MERNMKILVVVPRQELTNKINYDYGFPLGLGYISSTLKKAGYKVDCLNLNHYNGTTEDLINKVLDKKKYDFVCTGTLSSGYDITERIIDTVKDHKSKAKIILGGIIITSEPETVFNLLNPDFAVIGEGEETILELLEYIERNKNLKEVKGIGFRDKNGKIIFTEKKEPIQDLDSLPLPDFEGFKFEESHHKHANLSNSNMFDYPRIYPILGSRGCPFNCTFCYHYNRYRKRSIDNIMEELNIMVKKYQINIILFYDECIALDKERLYELCRGIKKLREEISWDLKWITQLTAHNIDEEMLKVMKDAGVDTIGYGFESFSPIVLKSMRKPTTPEMINEAFHKTLKVGMGIQANFIFGDVAETKETARETLEWWKKNCKGQVDLDFILPYPGSEIYKHCLKKGIIKDKVDFIKTQGSTNTLYNMTDKMTDKEIGQLKKEISVARYKYSRSVRPISTRKMKENIYELRVKCPFCGKIENYKNCDIRNKGTYEFRIYCRGCHLRFFVASFVTKIVHKYWPNFELALFLRGYPLKIFKYLKIKKKSKAC